MLLLLTLPGCRITPRYRVPSIAVPPEYKEAVAPAWMPAQPADAATRGDWWILFQDPVLDALEAKVNPANQNIAIAYANYNASRAAVREARSRSFPTVTVGTGLENTRLSVVPAVNLSSGFSYTEYTFPAQASWEPDLWGAVRNNVHAAAFTAQSNAANLESVRLAMHAQLAMDYFLFRSQDAQAEVLDQVVASEQQTLNITTSLMHAGLATDEAVSAAEGQLHSFEAQREAIRITRAQYEHAIAVLMGVAPAELSIPAGTSHPMLPALPPGLPSVLLQRRPDIAASERAVAAANAEIGVARSAYFPQLLLSATAGFASLNASDWFTWPSRIWALGPSVTETVFDAGLRRATTAEYQARFDAAVANYRQTVLTAFQQVEDTLAATEFLQRERAKQDAAVSSSERALDEAQVRYKAGLDPYLNVLAAQQTLLSYRQTAVLLEAQQANATVQLVQALGGGWNSGQLPSYKTVAHSHAP